MKKYHVGYTQGVYDMFHVGHLNILEKAKEQCDILVVGVNTDKLVQSYKHKTPVISEENRKRIVENLKMVDSVVFAESLDKIQMHEQVKFDAIFIGDDWAGSERWEKTEEDLAKIGVDVVFLPYTKGVSSTSLREVKDEQIEDN